MTNIYIHHCQLTLSHAKRCDYPRALIFLHHLLAVICFLKCPVACSDMNLSVGLTHVSFFRGEKINYCLRLKY